MFLYHPYCLHHVTKSYLYYACPSSLLECLYLKPPLYLFSNVHLNCLTYKKHIIPMDALEEFHIWKKVLHNNWPKSLDFPKCYNLLRWGGDRSTLLTAMRPPRSQIKRPLWKSALDENSDLNLLSFLFSSLHSHCSNSLHFYLTAAVSF